MATIKDLKEAVNDGAEAALSDKPQQKTTHSYDAKSLKLHNDDIPEIKEAFFHVILSKKPSIGIERWKQNGALPVILPELCEGIDCDQNEFHRYDVYYHNVFSCDAAEPQAKIRMSALFHDIGKPRTRRIRTVRGKKRPTFYNHEIISTRMTHKIVKRFSFEPQLSQNVSTLVKNHMFHYTKEWGDRAIRRFTRNIGFDNVKDLFLLRQADRIGSGYKSAHSPRLEQLYERMRSVIEQDATLRIHDLALGGSHLIDRFSLKPGPYIGQILKHIFERVQRNEIPNDLLPQLQAAESFIRTAFPQLMMTRSSTDKLYFREFVGLLEAQPSPPTSLSTS